MTWKRPLPTRSGCADRTTAEPSDDAQPASRSRCGARPSDSPAESISNTSRPDPAVVRGAGDGRPRHVRSWRTLRSANLPAVLQHLPTTPRKRGVLFRCCRCCPTRDGSRSCTRWRAAAPSGGAGMVDAIERIAVAPERRAAGTHVWSWRRPSSAGCFRPRRTAESAGRRRSRPPSLRRAAAVRSAGPADAIGEADRQSAAPSYSGGIRRGRTTTIDRPTARSCGGPAFYACLVVLTPFPAAAVRGEKRGPSGEQTLTGGAARRAAALLHVRRDRRERGHREELGFIKTLLGVPGRPGHPVRVRIPHPGRSRRSRNRARRRGRGMGTC